MRKAKEISPLPLAGEGQGEGATFIDAHYQQRTIDIDGTTLEVRGGRVTVADPALIEALDHMYGMTREKN